LISIEFLKDLFCIHLSCIHFKRHTI